jgi:hypothetical protein
MTSIDCKVKIILENNSPTNSTAHICLKISRCPTDMMLRIPNNGTGLMVILELMRRANLRVRFASGICSAISTLIDPV